MFAVGCGSVDKSIYSIEKMSVDSDEIIMAHLFRSVTLLLIETRAFLSTTVGTSPRGFKTLVKL